MFSLYLAAAKIRSSTELTVIRRKTRTSFFCPIRCARSTNYSNLNYISERALRGKYQDIEAPNVHYVSVP